MAADRSNGRESCSSRPMMTFDRAPRRQWADRSRAARAEPMRLRCTDVTWGDLRERQAGGDGSTDQVQPHADGAEGPRCENSARKANAWVPSWRARLPVRGRAGVAGGGPFSEVALNDQTGTRHRRLAVCKAGLVKSREVV
jgi:hypothetical protein